MGVSDSDIIDALGSVYDPCCEERGISVVDMGLVRSIQIDENNVRVELVLTSGWCPFASRVLASVKERVEHLPQIERAEVDITWDEAWTMDRMSDDARAKLVFLPEPKAVSDRSEYIALHRKFVSHNSRGDLR